MPAAIAFRGGGKRYGTPSPFVPQHSFLLYLRFLPRDHWTMVQSVVVGPWVDVARRRHADGDGQCMSMGALCTVDCRETMSRGNSANRRFRLTAEFATNSIREAVISSSLARSSRRPGRPFVMLGKTFPRDGRVTSYLAFN